MLDSRFAEHGTVFKPLLCELFFFMFEFSKETWNIPTASYIKVYMWTWLWTLIVKMYEDFSIHCTLKNIVVCNHVRKLSIISHSNWLVSFAVWLQYDANLIFPKNHVVRLWKGFNINCIIECQWSVFPFSCFLAHLS